MKFFDCDMAYGRAGCPLPREIETAADLLAEMDHSGIDQALVWHRDAFERDFARGNNRLSELEPFPRLHPTRAFLPPFTPEMPDAEDFVSTMLRDGVRAARAFPSRHGFLLDPVSCGAIFDLFISHNLPVLVPITEFPGGWRDIYQLLANFPALTLVLTEVGGWGQDRFFRPLLHRYPRLYLTTNRMVTAGQLKEIVHGFGPERVLFGSGAPSSYPGQYIMMLMRAAISDEAKEAIAHKNIERLLEAVTL